MVRAYVGNTECSEYYLRQSPSSNETEQQVTAVDLSRAVQPGGSLEFGCQVPPGQGSAVPVQVSQMIPGRDAVSSVKL